MVFNFVQSTFPIYFGLDGLNFNEIRLNFENFATTNDFFIFEIIDTANELIPEANFIGYWANSVLKIKGNFDEENLADNDFFKKQIKYGIHLNAYSILLPAPQKKNINYARFINKFLDNKCLNTELWIKININDKESWDNFRNFR
jgi:hypothetical protein